VMRVVGCSRYTFYPVHKLVCKVTMGNKEQ
jgi:hypothetical protein